MKKILCSLLACVMLFGTSTVAFAAESTPAGVPEDNDACIVVDFNEMDMTKPFEISTQYVNEQGETITIGAIYTPNEDWEEITPMWSHDYEATVGTWTSYFDGSIIDGMSYQYDVSRSGSHWKISNARNFLAHCVLSTVRDKQLTINRATSTSSSPAEVMGICTVDVIDTPIGHVMSMDAWIKTTITDGGTLTVSGN